MNEQQQNGSVKKVINARRLPHLPPLTQQQMLAQPSRQVDAFAEEEADPSYSGHFAGLHPEHRTYTTADNELEEDERYYTTRLPTSARRYQGYTLSPETVYRSGNTRLHVRSVDIPRRHSRHQQLPPPGPRSRDGGATSVPQETRSRRRVHPLVYVGVSMLAMIACFLVLSSAATWAEHTKDDLTYGRPRTFHLDAVVGHNDAPQSPSHFIALNLNRHVVVIEIPGGDTSKMKVYQITTLFGNGEDVTPVTLSFRDVTGDGKPDMLIRIENQTLVFVNDNGSFRPARAGEVTGLL
jgi:hypothetical protein